MNTIPLARSSAQKSTHAYTTHRSGLRQCIYKMIALQTGFHVYIRKCGTATCRTSHMHMHTCCGELEPDNCNRHQCKRAFCSENDTIRSHLSVVRPNDNRELRACWLARNWTEMNRRLKENERAREGAFIDSIIINNKKHNMHAVCQRPIWYTISYQHRQIVFNK